MSIHENLQEFGGLPVHDFSLADDLPEPDTVAWRISGDYDGPTWAETFDDFLEEVDSARVTALVIGSWVRLRGQSGPHPVDLLVEEAARFPALRNLFVADMTGEQNEISWIDLPELTGLFTAFPDLERLGVRGNRTRLAPVRHAKLRELRFESGGLPGNVVRALGVSDLPALEHLELWLGVAHYGGDTTVADLEPILNGERLPSLWYLGLCNSEIQDEIAEAVASAPIVARLTELDLSKGTLSDRGAEALLSGQPLIHLEALDLDHHFMSATMADRLVAELPDVEVYDESRTPDAFDGEEFRYVAVSE